MKTTPLAAENTVLIETGSAPAAYAPVKWNPESATENSSVLEATEHKLATIIPEVDFHDTSLPKALSFLQNKTGVPMVAIPTANSESSQPLTLLLKKESAAECLRYISTLAGLKQRIEPGAVIFTPMVACNIPPMISMEIPLAPWFEEQKLVEQKVSEILAGNGVLFPPGSSLHYDSSKGCITVCNTEQNIDRIEEVWSALCDTAPWPSEREQARFRRKLYSQRVASWKKALSETSVIRAEFRNASMEEIATALRLKATPWIGIQVGPDARVTLSTKGGSLLELLQKIAAESHTRLILGWQSVVFVSSPGVD